MDHKQSREKRANLVFGKFWQSSLTKSLFSINKAIAREMIKLTGKSELVACAMVHE